MKRMHWMTIALVVLVAAGCAGSKLSDKESAADSFPDTRFLTAEAAGATEGEAKRAAMAELAAIFESRVYARTLQQATSWMGEGLPEQFDKQVEQTVRINTDVQLEGARIGRVWPDEATGEIRALAVLDRRQSAEILRHKIQELDQDIQILFTGVQEKRDKLACIKKLKEAIRKHILREACDAELRIVNISGEGILPKTGFTEMKNRLSAVLLRDFLIALSVEGSRADEIREALVQGLNLEGFSVCEDIGRASVLVRGTVEIKPIDRGTPEWKYVRWKTHFDLVDRRGGAVFGSIGKTGREGHVNLLQAEDRAVRKMQNILTTDIVRDITKYILR